MKVRTRHSSIKKRRIVSFLSRMKTHGGRRIIRNQRRRRAHGKESCK